MAPKESFIQCEVEKNHCKGLLFGQKIKVKSQNNPYSGSLLDSPWLKVSPPLSSDSLMIEFKGYSIPLQIVSTNKERTVELKIMGTRKGEAEPCQVTLQVNLEDKKGELCRY